MHLSGVVPFDLLDQVHYVAVWSSWAAATVVVAPLVGLLWIPPYRRTDRHPNAHRRTR